MKYIEIPEFEAQISTLSNCLHNLIPHSSVIYNLVCLTSKKFDDGHKQCFLEYAVHVVIPT